MIIQALVMGLVQGLTEFLPISSSGHLIVVPYLLGWHDPFIDSLTFSVILHLGTLIALLIYFWREWLALVPAGLASIRDRSLADDPQRKLTWLIVIATIPAVIFGPLLNDTLEQAIRTPGLVAITLVIGAAILLIAERYGSRRFGLESLSFRGALAIGVAQALALVPGISRSGISISTGMGLGLDRESAARFSFLMAAPVIAGAGIFEARKLVGPGAEAANLDVLVVGFVASAIAGLAAIHFLLGYLRRSSTLVFVAYRVALAAVVAAAVLR